MQAKSLHPQANGHRRRQLVKRVKREENTCALCDEPVDLTLTMSPDVHGPRCKGNGCRGCVPHPMRGEVDEDIPRSRGGSPYMRSNCHLMHRKCNWFKSDMTLTEARVKWHARQITKQPEPVTTSPIW